jgi:hypothetical protein
VRSHEEVVLSCLDFNGQKQILRPTTPKLGDVWGVANGNAFEAIRDGNTEADPLRLRSGQAFTPLTPTRTKRAPGPQARYVQDDIVFMMRISETGH